MTLPRVSVVTAARTPEPALLLRAHASLGRQAARWEWLIQVDGDGDVPSAIARDERVSVAANEERLGAAAARNRALVRSRAPLVLSLDADDALLDGALDALAAALDAAPSAAFAFGGVERELAGGEIERRPYPWFAPGRVEPGAIERVWRAERLVPISGGAVMWRRDVLFAYGGWAALSGSEDSALLLAAALDRDGVYVGRDVVLQGVHPGQTSATPAYAAARPANWAFVEERLRALRALRA